MARRMTKKQMAEAQKEHEQDTATLRKLWTHAAAKVVERTRNGEPVDLSDVRKLQDNLEAIEGRAELDHLRKLTT